MKGICVLNLGGVKQLKLVCVMEKYAWSGENTSVYDSGNTSKKQIGYYLRCYVSNNNGETSIQGSNDNSTWATIDKVTTNAVKSGVIETTYRYFRIRGVSWQQGNINSGGIFVME